MHCPDVNATEPIWRVLASSDGISSWTPLKPQHSTPCWLSSGNPVHVDYASTVKKKGIIKVCGWICSVWPSWVRESQHASTGNSVSWSLGHSSRSSFHCMAFFPSLKQNIIAYRSYKVQIAFLKFTRLPAFLESLMPLKNWSSIHARCSKSSLKHSTRFCGIFFQV